MQYEVSEDDQQKIESIFTYHSPAPEQVERYQVIRDEAKKFAQLLQQSCPPGRELSVAITKLQECVMFANASIAIGEVI